MPVLALEATRADESQDSRQHRLLLEREITSYTLWSGSGIMTHVVTR